jgi:hypothetical protein
LLSTNDRHRPGVAHHGEIALDAPGIEILGQRRDQEDGVDVGGHHLLLDRTTGGFSRDGAAPVETTDDDGALSRRRGGQADPVADRGKVCRHPSVVTESAAHLGPSVEVTRDPIGASLFFHYARDKRSRRLFRELLREEITPPHALERKHAGILALS